MSYPFKSYSWTLFSDSIAQKAMDKSTFTHHGTAIPREIAHFFDLPRDGIDENRPVILEVDNIPYDAHIKTDPLSRFQLHWKADLEDVIRSRFPQFQKAYEAKKALVGDGPIMRFERLRPDNFKVEFIDPESRPEEIEADEATWSEEELEASIDAYLFMLDKWSYPVSVDTLA